MYYCVEWKEWNSWFNLLYLIIIDEALLYFSWRKGMKEEEEDLINELILGWYKE